VDRNPEKVSLVAWTSLGILVLISIVSYLDRQVIYLLVEPIKKDLGLSDFSMGLLQGVAFGLFYAIFAIPVGWLVDRYSRRIIIYLGMTLWSISAATCGLANGFLPLFLARFGVGVGEASLSPSAYSVIGDLFPVRRLAMALGIFATGSAIGSASAYMASGALISKLESMGEIVIPGLGSVAPWQAVFMMTGAPGLLLAFLVFLIPEPKRKDIAPVTGRAAAGFGKYLLSHKRYYGCHFFGYGLIAVVSYAAAAWFPTVLIRNYGLTYVQAGFIMGLVAMFTGVPGFVISGWAVDRWYARGRTDAHLRYFVWAALISAAVALVAFGLSTSVSLAVLGYGIVHFLQPFTGPAVGHLHLATPSAYRGRTSAIFLLVFNVMGMCIGPPLVGFLTDFVFKDPQAVRLSLAVVYVVTVLLAGFLFMLGLPAARRIIEERLGAAEHAPTAVYGTAGGQPRAVTRAH